MSGFYRLPEQTYMMKSLTDPEEWILTEAPDAALFSHDEICCLDKYALNDFARKHREFINVEIPEEVECWPDMILMTSCYLNLLIHPTLKYLGAIFWRVTQFEENLGGRIYYTGTREQWDALIASNPGRNTYKMDYTSYDDIVEFVGEDFTLPEMDYHTVSHGEQKCEQIRYSTWTGAVQVPASYTDQDGVCHPLSGVGILASAFNEGVEKVIIPPEISYIGMEAFRDCKNLKEVWISDGDTMIEIDEGAFYNCNQLEHIHIGRKARIAAYAFAKNGGEAAVIDSVQDMDDETMVDEKAFLIL